MRFFILAALLVTQVSFAADVTFLKKGELANYDGFLFSIPKELEVRKAVIELDTTKLLLDNSGKLLTLKDSQVVLLTEQVKVWQDQSKALSEQLVAKEQSRFWYFAGGAALTTLLAFAVNKATK